MNKRLLTILTSFILILGVWITVGHPVEDLKTLNYYTVQQVLNRVTGTAGSAIPSGLLMIGGSDGTNARALKVNSSGEIPISAINNTVSTPVYIADIRNGRAYPHSVTACGTTTTIKNTSFLLSAVNIWRAVDPTVDSPVEQGVVLADTVGNIYSGALGVYEASKFVTFPYPISAATILTATFAKPTRHQVCVRAYYQ